MNPETCKRLSRQCLVILDLLRRRDATNDELSRIARKYTGRISEIRKAGHNVLNYGLDKKTGLSYYHLEPPVAAA